VTRGLWLLSGVGTAVLWTWVRGVGDLSNGGVPGFLALWSALSVVYLLTLALQVRFPLRWRLRDLLLVALAFRLIALGMDPSLSHDYARYVWEGRVQWAGVNPYLTAPADAALAPLRDATWLRVNHPQVPAIYGPLLQLLFAVLALFPGELAFRLAFVAVDLGVVALVARLLARRGLRRGWALAYAWHPLPILEVAGQAHLEVIPVALTLLALDLHERKRARGAAVALGAAIAAKYLPVLVLPALVLRSERWLATLGWVAVPLLLAYAPYVLSDPRWGLGLLGGLGAYAERWRFNAGGFALLDWALLESGLAPDLVRAWAPSVAEWLNAVGVDARLPDYDVGLDWSLLQVPAKLAVGVVVLVTLGWQALRRWELERSVFTAGALFLLGSPVVHPWYALWVVPFLALRRGRLAWLFLSLALPVSYAVLLGYDGTPGTWQESPWARAIEYVPFALLLVGGWVAARKAGETT